MAKSKKDASKEATQHDETCMCRRCRTRNNALHRKRIKISGNISVSDFMNDFSDSDFFEDEEGGLVTP